MKKLNLVSIATGAVLLGGIYLLARSDGSVPMEKSGPISQLQVSEELFDFGTISMRAGTVSHEFTVRNNGTESVVIAKIYTSCMCTEASIETKEGKIGPFGMAGHGMIPIINRVIAPGEEAKIETVFDPAAHGPSGVGRIARVVYLESKGSEPLELKFQANVKP
jgi:hypothetical protein